jgi:antitoxin ParD1/3/4
MPSKHSLNVSLTGELRDFVAKQVASGRFRTSSEIVRAALRLLETKSGSRERSPSLGRRALAVSKAKKIATRALSSRS